MSEIAPVRENHFQKALNKLLEKTGHRKPTRLQPHFVTYHGKTYPYGTIDTRRGEKPTDNAALYENMVDTDEINERPASDNFQQIIEGIDHFFFSNSPTKEGWRDYDVYAGNYLAPKHENVIPLMNLLTAKMDELYPQIKPTDLYKFVAWVCWAIVEIHPKRNGNGRLSKAVAEYLLPEKKLIGYNSPTPKEAFDAFHYGMMDEVEQRSKAPWPPIVLTRTVAGRVNSWQKTFYRHQDHDWVNDIIEEKIKQTTIDQTGLFVTPVNLKKLALLESYLQAAPPRDTKAK